MVQRAHFRATPKAIAAGVLLLAAACGREPVRTVDASLQPGVRQYLRLAVALGERDPDSLDYFYGPLELVADIRKQPPTFGEIKREADHLISELRSRKSDRSEGDGAEDERRVDYLIGQLRAISSRVGVVTGAPLTFDQETEAVFGITIPEKYGAPQPIEAKATLQALLPGRGSLAARYAAFDGRFLIPGKKIPLVMERAIAACRAETLAHVEMPRGEKVELRFVHNKPWSGYSYYQGNYRSLVEINLDYGLTVDRALQLACHESYPGHHLYNSLQDEKLVRGAQMDELAVQPSYSPQSLASEASATLAADLAFPRAKRLALERDVLFPLAGLDGRKAARYLRVEGLVDELYPAEFAIARDYLDGKLEFERANTALEERALMAHAEPALKYINEYRSYVATYTYGRDLAARYLAGPNGELRWARYLRRLTSYPVWLAGGDMDPVRPEGGSGQTYMVGRRDGPAPGIEAGPDAGQPARPVL
ncbi:MAG TPA: hypothetical protein VGR96_02555 [Acidobacteriaceae bacterium]|nr:hypothetical protein [Acidobacteriaceae bacterium]